MEQRQTVVKATTNNPCLSAKNDPLIGFFRWGRKLFPTLNSHACIVEGEIDPDTLGHALRRTIGGFEQLRDLIAANAVAQQKLQTENAVTVIASEQPVSFDDTTFRDRLTALLAAAEESNDDLGPVRLHLIHTPDRQQSCIHLGISHDVADIKSGNIFFARLMREYTKLIQYTDSVSGVAVEAESFSAHLPLDRLKPAWFTGKQRITRWAKANIAITRRMVTRSRSQVKFPASNERLFLSERETDFRHIPLSQQLGDSLRLAARRYNVTINTLISAALVRYIGNSQRQKHSQAVYTIAVSLRKLLGADYAETFRSYMIDCTLRIPHALSDRLLLARVEQQTADARRDGLEVELGRMESAVTLFKIPLPRAAVLWIMGRTQGTNILYSNPGIVEEDFTTFGPGGPAISAMTIFGCLVPPYDLMFHTPTIGGKLQLDLVYRRSCFSDIDSQFVRPFLTELERFVTAMPKEAEEREKHISA